MRAVRKGPEPRALLDWKVDNAAVPENLGYGVASFPGEAVRQALLAEQFHLCAYTLKRLKTAQQCQPQDTRQACHIEHILPQSRRVAGEDIDYQNMVACHPPSQSGVRCPYGAQAKADYDPSELPFVSPLQASVEPHFQFQASGEVEGMTAAGRATVQVLNLNHPALVHDRQAVIQGWLRLKTRHELSAAQARRLAEWVLQPGADLCLEPFCVAIAQAALAHAERLERRATRLRGRSER